ncbi:hypothetical protein [Cyanobium sp. Morenito 9A2]|uniref:hypothetical protein n=1 Tax=Cyanobium sp. Morenito 9A2 TaxID=2823718 RepID=UPI0020CF2B65|nr:hypothetical protein [Cyanobium sp. Morenito 9A2]MCP9849041.1 hypothetical protein [Cyanobium sp. Morenito 9A2]
MSSTALILLLLGLGQTVVVPGTTATVRLESVEDHRCPKGVQCVWAGYVAATLGVREAPGQAIRQVVLSQPPLQTSAMTSRLVLQGQALTLESVEPQRSFQPKGPAVPVRVSLGVSPAS